MKLARMFYYRPGKTAFGDDYQFLGLKRVPLDRGRTPCEERGVTERKSDRRLARFVSAYSQKDVAGTTHR